MAMFLMSLTTFSDYYGAYDKTNHGNIAKVSSNNFSLIIFQNNFLFFFCNFIYSEKRMLLLDIVAELERRNTRIIHVLQLTNSVKIINIYYTIPIIKISSNM